MSERIRTHLRTNVVGYIAIFLFAIGGTAYATHPGGANTISSDDIINGEVTSSDLGAAATTVNKLAPDAVTRPKIADDAVTAAEVADAAIRAPELATNAVTSLEVRNGELTTDDLGPGSVASDEIANQTVTGTDLAGTGFGDDGFDGDEEIIDGTIGGFDIGNDEIGANHIVDGSLSAGDTSDVFDAGYGSDVACNDDDEDGEVCASTTFTLNQPGVLLVNATGEWRTATSGGDGVEMTCVLQVDGADIGVAQSIGEGGTNHTTSQNGTMALTALSPQLEAGSHTVQTLCSRAQRGHRSR